MTTQHPNAPQLPTRRLVYGHAQLHDCLAFADADTAADEAREIVAIASSRTWGEARRVAPRHIWNPVGPDYHDPDDGPADDEPFDINDVGSVQDGNWPPMVTARTLKLLPKDLQARFGEDTDTVFNGDYLEIPLFHEAELVAELRERGFEVSRDDDLINVLDGRSFGSVD
ncbi:hypothetical protein [Micromonospora sp. NPDC049679]|uniref:hypothetical protein n=1 Tax=Micromonospora sp. NPDC049679 TaxID=3155920 RepID=UPI0033EDEB95